MTPSRTATAAGLACALGLTGGCGGGGDDRAPAPSGGPTAASAPPPSYSVTQVRSALLEKADVGPKWTDQPLSLDATKKRQVVSCSGSAIDLPGDPKLVASELGEPDNDFTGAIYARLVAVYDDPDAAGRAFQRIQDATAECPSKKKVPFKRLPQKKFTYQHDDTWERKTDRVAEWTRVRGFEKAVYPASVSVLNVFYFAFDYALRGNVVFTSAYWKRVKAKSSGEPVEKRADELLGEQLERLG